MIPDDLIEALRNTDHLAVLTGAGVSAESGIPTFRDAMEGLWAKYDANQLATPEAFAANPELVSRWYDWRRQKCAAAKPNPGHLALARFQSWMEQRKRQFNLITQNVDRLHQAAGSYDVIELHGTLWVWRCTLCGRESEEREVPFNEYPPKCLCGGNRRPAVVWFGESLPEDAFEKAHRNATDCDLFFSVGTSAVVYPAADLAHAARRSGAKTVEINAQPTPLTQVVDWFIRGKSGEILPLLAQAAIEDRPSG